MSGASPVVGATAPQAPAPGTLPLRVPGAQAPPFPVRPQGPGASPEVTGRVCAALKRL